MKREVYYAHPLNIYNTAQEKRDIAMLESLGFEVVNPNCAECAEGYKAKGMEFFKQFAQACDAVAFRALASGENPAGIVSEVGWFRGINKPVLEMPTGFLRRSIDEDKTRELLDEAGFRQSRLCRKSYNQI